MPVPDDAMRGSAARAVTPSPSEAPDPAAAASAGVSEPLARLFLCGDVMSGRGIDQILPRPSEPRLFEPFVRSAVEYVQLAESVSGPLPRRVESGYIWGAALGVLSEFDPHVRIVNLETAVTRSTRACPGKQIHYRMHPANISALAAARIDCCVLANNHVLDWGEEGLQETLTVLHHAGIATAGAGADEDAAGQPAVLPCAAGTRVLVFGVAVASSGVPRNWRAGEDRPGVNWLARPSVEAAERLARRIAVHRRPGDQVVVSIHWGGNWGYPVQRQERRFAHWLIDHAAVDLVHGHSSHHPRGLEVHRDRLILYGCGDFLNDYEGIGGYDSFRPELTLMYLPVLDSASGTLRRARLVPLRIRRFQLQSAAPQEAEWLTDTLDRESRGWGTRVRLEPDGTLAVQW